MKTGFFAYSSQPISVSESIEGAIQTINNSGLATLKSWKSYEVNGKLIFDEVTKAINEADYFCADLTGFSNNVLFELGYAMTKNKPIFLILDDTYIDSKKQYKEFSSLTTTGYKKYTNSINIVEGFSKFISDLSPQPKLKEKQNSPSDSPLLFLKNHVDTTYSQIIAKKIEDYKIPCNVDDASENAVQPLEWYMERLNKATLIEFSSTSRAGHELQNSKCSFIAGISLGYDLEILMVVEEPYNVPIDYRDLLIKYSTKKRCEQVVSEFLDSLKLEIVKSYSQVVTNNKNKKQLTEFQKISFGEFLAEHESEILVDYYVETFNMSNLTNKDYNIVVGRKGTGKTATLYYLKSLLEQDPRNHICLIKPVTFEIDALITMLQVPSGEEYEKSYLVESTWKFLIYTEIAKSVYIKLNAKNLFALSQAEINFKEFIENNSDLFLKDFSERLEEELDKIRQAKIISGELRISDFKIKLAELMHSQTLAETRNLLAKLFEKNKRILVLIDNLDKSWQKNSKINLQSNLLLGLLSVSGSIVKELKSFNVKGQLNSIDFHLTIFLRSDIFKYIRGVAREPDKIEYTDLLKLGDKDVLFRIIEERFVQLSSDEIISSKLWDKYIIKNVDDLSIRDYIYEKIIPRPRDIIYFFKSPHENAISRGHVLIQEEDIRSGYEDYSAWVFTSMMVEDSVDVITTEQLKDFMYEFVGEEQIVSRESLYLAMCKSKLSDSEEDLENLIERLSTLSILAKEVNENQFEFEYFFEKKEIINARSRKLNSSRYKIHNALAPYLELLQR